MTTTAVTTTAATTTATTTEVVVSPESGDLGETTCSAVDVDGEGTGLASFEVGDDHGGEHASPATEVGSTAVGSEVEIERAVVPDRRRFPSERTNLISYGDLQTIAIEEWSDEDNQSVAVERESGELCDQIRRRHESADGLDAEDRDARLGRVRDRRRAPLGNLAGIRRALHHPRRQPPFASLRLGPRQRRRRREDPYESRQDQHPPDAFEGHGSPRFAGSLRSSRRALVSVRLSTPV